MKRLRMEMLQMQMQMLRMKSGETGVGSGSAARGSRHSGFGAMVLVALTIVASGARVASAAPQLLVFTGHVTEVEDGGGELDGSIEVGTEFTARLTLDESMVECDIQFGTNVCTGPNLLLEVSLGSYTLRAVGAPTFAELVSESAHVWILKEEAREPEWPDGAYSYVPRMRNATVVEGPPIETRGSYWTELVLIEPDETHRETLDFFIPGSLEGWTHRRLSFKAQVGFDVQGTIETLSVPEPSHALLQLAALGCVGLLAQGRGVSRRGRPARSQSP